jgi:hypothetical protein
VTARSDRDVWLELVAAVDYLSVTHRLGMTICDAIEEAVRSWTTARRSGGMLFPSTSELPWDDPDPLRSTLADLLMVIEPVEAPTGLSASRAIVSALDAWLHDVAEQYNQSYGFTPRTRGR